MNLSKALRFGGAAVLASALVLTATGYIVHKTRRPAHEMTMNVVKGIHKITMSEVNALLGVENKRERPKPKKPPAPPPLPPRQVSGIVQIAYTVQPDGSATDIRVTGAAPAGYYEKQARTIIANSYHKPAMGDDHRLHAREASTIIHFTVPAHEAATAAAPDQAQQP
ncbi:MAG TPA: hypothetical protein VFK45_02580 [Gammaproteobacteria bacterium]|nr:hypothetical protein [Gammaproteobacteria bacterium]